MDCFRGDTKEDSEEIVLDNQEHINDHPGFMGKVKREATDSEYEEGDSKELIAKDPDSKESMEESEETLHNNWARTTKEETCPGEEIVKIWGGKCRAKVQVWTDKENNKFDTYILRTDKDGKQCQQKEFCGGQQCKNNENCFYALEGEQSKGQVSIRASLSNRLFVPILMDMVRLLPREQESQSRK